MATRLYNTCFHHIRASCCFSVTNSRLLLRCISHGSARPTYLPIRSLFMHRVCFPSRETLRIHASRYSACCGITRNIHIGKEWHTLNNQTRNDNMLGSAQDTTQQKARVILGQIVQPTPSSRSSDEKKGDSTDSKKKKDARTLWWTKFSFAMFGISTVGSFIYLVIMWGPPERDLEGNVIKDEFSAMSMPTAYFLRTKKAIMREVEDTRAPSRKKLLPEPLQEPYFQPPYTLVLELTDVLVHPEYNWHTGWRFKKRPGVDYFLQQIAPPAFEVVVYTYEGGHTAWPVLDSLDPNGFIMYRLFRDATRYENGNHVKELDSLNRDLSKVIAVDWNSNALSHNSENALIIKKWDGSIDDSQLVDLANFLRTIAATGVEDVRTVLKHYSGEDDPLETFRENQRRLQEEQIKTNAAQKEKEEKKGRIGNLSGGIGGLMGFRR